MLGKENRKLLAQIEKGKVIRSCLENKDLDYLYELKLIEMTIYPEPTDPFVQPYLTDYGKAYLEEYRRQRFHRILGTFLALIGVMAALIPLAAPQSNNQAAPHPSPTENLETVTQN